MIDKPRLTKGLETAGLTPLQAARVAVEVEWALGRAVARKAALGRLWAWVIVVQAATLATACLALWLALRT